MGKYWYRVCYYDAEGFEYYYAGTYSYRQAKEFLKNACKFSTGINHSKLFKNDSFIEECWKDE